MSQTDIFDQPDIQQPDELSESQMPVVDANSIDFEELAVPELAAEAPSFSPQDFAQKMLEVALEYVGVTRANNRQQVTKFLNLFGLGFTDPNGVPYKFCASGVSYSACKAYCLLSGIQFTPANSVAVFRTVLRKISQSYFLPSTVCETIRQNAITRGSYKSKAEALEGNIFAGWIVFYSFDGSARADHCGIVIDADEEGMHTMEFNTSSASSTNGGACAQKHRTYGSVLGFAALY